MKEKIKLFITRKTRKARHALVKIVAPKIYEKYLEYCRSISAGLPRPMIVFIKTTAKNNSLVGAEIGVAEGLNAQSILEELPIKKLFLIDPFTAYSDSGRMVSPDPEMAKERLMKYPNVVFIRKSSDQAVKDIDELLDFVYIDGDHSYEAVKKDIELYYPLVKGSGVIGGHDYNATPLVGVNQAVDEFIQKHGLTKNFHVSHPDWWVEK